MKIDRQLLREYRRNPERFKEKFKKLREQDADGETIRCNLIPFYTPKISSYARLTGLGAMVAFPLIGLANKFIGANPVVDETTQWGTVFGILTVINTGLTSPIERALRIRAGKKLKKTNLAEDVIDVMFESSGLSHLTRPRAGKNSKPETINEYAVPGLGDNNPYRYRPELDAVNRMLEIVDNNPYRYRPELDAVNRMLEIVDDSPCRYKE